MGTTAQKLQRVLDTKEGLKDTINTYLGQDITSAIPFKDYETYIKNFYNAAPKTEFEEGSDITLENTLKGKLDFEDGIVGIGDTSQYTTTGKQLIPLNEADFTTTYYGQNVEIKNQTIKINGSASDIYSISVGKNGLVAPTSTDRITFEVNSGTYKYTQFATGTAYSGIKVRLKDENTGTMYVSESTITLTETHTFSVNIFIEDTNNKNAEIKIQLESGTTAHNWEPYTNGASPNPSYPQEVKVVRGKNVVDWANTSYTNQNNATTTRSGAEYSVTCGSSQFGYAFFSQDNLKLKPNTDYVFRAKIKSTTNTSGSRIRVNPLMTSTNTEIYSSLTTAGNIASITFKTPSTIPSGAGVGLYPYAVDKNAVFTDIMICEGIDTNTSYLPYNTLEVVKSGKNYWGGGTYTNGTLFKTNENGTIDATLSNQEGTSAVTTQAVQAGIVKTLKAGTYTFSATGLDNGYLAAHIVKVNSATSGQVFQNLTNVTTSKTFTITEDINYFVRVQAVQPITFTGTIYLQIESGDTATSFEPYITPITKQLSLGNFKPSKIGNYKDYFYRTYGKNKFDNSVERKNAYIGASGSDIGTAITYYNSSATYSYVNCAYVEAGKTYTLSWKQSTTPASTNLRVGAIVDNNNIILNTQNTWTNSSTSITFTPNVSGYLVLCTDINATNIQIELGNTATDYNPYGSGEWYFKAKNGNTQITSSTSIVYDTSLTNVSRFRTTITNVINATQNGSAYCNVLINKDGFSLDEEHFYIFGAAENKTMYFFIPNSIASNLSQLQTWLTTNFMEVYYTLLNATDTKITDTTMITQLEDIYNLMSYTGTTILEVDGDLPLIIKTRALKGE